MTVSGHTKVVGVWGCPVAHSRSPAMHNAALKALGLDWVYVPFEVQPKDLPAAVEGLRALGMIGVNVTVPHKEAILPLLDEVDIEAQRIGSVNTICNKEGRLHGYSTDGLGFLQGLERSGERTGHRRALILGAGGSARAVAFALAGRGSEVILANRTAERAWALTERINAVYPGQGQAVEWGGAVSDVDLVVNTTSLGMEPRADTFPVLPERLLHPGVCVYDLVYAPPETMLLHKAHAAGCKTINGLPMLAAQGAYSLCYWTGLNLGEVPLSLMLSAAEAGDGK